MSDSHSSWGDCNSSLALQGIFVDETPTQYSPESVSYLQEISNAVNSSAGIDGSYIGKQKFFMFNLTVLMSRIVRSLTVFAAKIPNTVITASHVRFP